MARAAWRMAGYRVEELIGAGASGEVWRGRVTSTGVGVALKRIWLADRDQRKAALSEAAMLSSLDHPHLMKLHEVRHVDDDIVLVLDLAAGGSLAALLARRGRLTVGEAITALAPIGAALAYAHNAGVVHGDVSAANVLFTDIGLPLLADLGVARLLGDGAPVRTTPSYADPTVARGAMPGPESDVFMLGGVALHALTGEPPWPGNVSAEVLDAAASGDEPDFAARLARAGVPEAVAAVVVRALTMHPGRRGTAADFALELRHADEPVAVELAAGRVRRLSDVISSSDRVESWPLQSVPAADGAGGDGAAAVATPPFVREQPLTYGVRAPSPFRDGPPGRHLARGRPRIAAGFAIGAALAVAALVGALLLWPFGRNPPPHRPAAAPTPVARATPTPPLRSAARPAQPSQGRQRSTSLQRRPAPVRSLPPSSILSRLDAQRSAAFARRDPALLSGVYDSSALLARDRALLLAIVPAGCGLHGVHTTFRRPTVVARSAGGLRVRVTASLAPSTLLCGASASAQAPGSVPAALVVDLERFGDGYRIVAQRRG